MPKNKWKVQYRVKRGSKWRTAPWTNETREVARLEVAIMRAAGYTVGAATYGPFGFGNTRVVRVK